MAKILLVNKFYYTRGGDCVAMLSTEQLLKAKGHEVAVFSMKYPQNIPSSWEDYFPDEISFTTGGLIGKIRASFRLFKPKDVADRFKRLLHDFKPDVVHLHNIHSYLSPVVAQIAHQQGIRVVWTMHDYKLICPAYSCLRNGEACDYCFSNKFNILKYGCLKNSFAASLLGWLEAVYWNRKKLTQITDRFISPSRFLRSKMVKAGFPSEKIEVLSNFIPKQINPVTSKKEYYCYVGRISEEKGIDTLLNAASQLPYRLIVIGDGPLLDTYQNAYNQENIEFTGYLPSDKVYEIVSHARFMVLPSICYENNPFSVIEALCMGTPVLGAQSGGIPELIEEGINGFLFTPKNCSELKEKIEFCFDYFHAGYNYQKIAEQAQNKFSPETFYCKLTGIYNISIH
jgi:glycosyltransferase involved in cell wall biosynthesis